MAPKIRLVRNVASYGNSNTLVDASADANLANVNYQFFEKSYTATGAQEWIYLPDANAVGVMVTIASTGTCQVDVTMSPPDVVDGGTAVTLPWATGSITASAYAVIQGATAIRLTSSANGSGIKLSVRC